MLHRVIKYPHKARYKIGCLQVASFPGHSQIFSYSPEEKSIFEYLGIAVCMLQCTAYLIAWPCFVKKEDKKTQPV